MNKFIYIVLAFFVGLVLVSGAVYAQEAELCTVEGVTQPCPEPEPETVQEAELCTVDGVTQPCSEEENQEPEPVEEVELCTTDGVTQPCTEESNNNGGGGGNNNNNDDEDETATTTATTTTSNNNGGGGRSNSNNNNATTTATSTPAEIDIVRLLTVAAAYGDTPEIFLALNEIPENLPTDEANGGVVAGASTTGSILDGQTAGLFSLFFKDGNFSWLNLLWLILAILILGGLYWFFFIWKKKKDEEENKVEVKK